MAAVALRGFAAGLFGFVRDNGEAEIEDGFEGPPRICRDGRWSNLRLLGVDFVAARQVPPGYWPWK